MKQCLCLLAYIIYIYVLLLGIRPDQRDLELEQVWFNQLDRSLMDIYDVIIEIKDD